MLYREIIAVCSEIHIKYTNKLCLQNVEFVNVKPGGPPDDRWPVTFYKKKSLCFCMISRHNRVTVSLIFLIM